MAPVNALGIGAEHSLFLQRIRGNGLQNLCTVESVILFKENYEKEGFDARYVLPSDSY